MDLTQSVRAGVHLAQSVPQKERSTAAAPGEAVHRSSGYGLPCSKCRLYYSASLDVCPTCNHKERVSPNVVPVLPKSQAAAEIVPDSELVEQEREAFLKEFKSRSEEHT